jgi:isocitrate dehydrogenase
MLRHLGLTQNAGEIENALLYTLEQGVRTGDFGDKDKPSVNTTEFAQAVIDNFGKKPEQGTKEIIPNAPGTPAPFKLEHNAMMVSKELFTETIVGVDMFMESSEQPEVMAQKCEHHGGNKFKLVSISNRGTQVWPTGSRYTNLINLYNVRFESVSDQPMTQLDIIGLYVTLCADFKICSFELLNEWDGKKAYSLAQGQ